jgi:hypothetical protein
MGAKGMEEGHRAEEQQGMFQVPFPPESMAHKSGLGIALGPHEQSSAAVHQVSMRGGAHSALGLAGFASSSSSSSGYGTEGLHASQNGSMLRSSEDSFLPNLAGTPSRDMEHFSELLRFPSLGQTPMKLLPGGTGFTPEKQGDAPLSPDRSLATPQTLRASTNTRRHKKRRSSGFGVFGSGFYGMHDDALHQLEQQPLGDIFNPGLGDMPSISPFRTPQFAMSHWETSPIKGLSPLKLCSTPLHGRDPAAGKENDPSYWPVYSFNPAAPLAAAPLDAPLPVHNPHHTRGNHGTLQGSPRTIAKLAPPRLSEQF